MARRKVSSNQASLFDLVCPDGQGAESPSPDKRLRREPTARAEGKAKIASRPNTAKPTSVTVEAETVKAAVEPTSRLARLPIDRRKATDEEKEEFHKYLRGTKRFVKQRLEKNNFTHIYVFDSGAPWYKMAFNSVLIYEYRILPHLKEVTYNIRPDSDSYFKSDVGVVGIRDIVLFASIMRSVGASIPESLKEYFFKNGRIKTTRPSNSERELIYDFEIEGMSRERFEVFLKAKHRKAEDLNTLILPAYIPRELYPDAHLLAQEVAKMTSRLPREVQAIYGREIGLMSITILRDINMACNGYYGGKEGFRKVLERTLERCAEIQEILRILMDSRLVSYGLCQNMTLMSIQIQKDALAEIKALEEENSRYIQAIKDAKNFPKILGVDLSGDLLKKTSGQHGYIETAGEEAGE